MSDFHRYSSWGRTRRPKNVAGQDGAFAVPAQNAGALTSTTAKTGADLRTTISSVVSLTGDLLNLGVASSTSYVVGEIIQITGTGQSWLDGEYSIADKDSGGANRITVRIKTDPGPRITVATQIPAKGTITRRTTSGYATENQRYLHVTNLDAAATIYVYNYASGIWRKLQKVIPDDGGTADATDAELAFHDWVVPLNSHVIIDIAGADRVAFTGTVSKTYLSTSSF